MKVCSTCKQEKELSQFGPEKRSRDKLSYRCHACSRESSKKIKKIRREKWSVEDAYSVHKTKSKTCPRCKENKNIIEFSRDKCNADGLQRQCKTCQIYQWRISQYNCDLPKNPMCAICGCTQKERKLGIDHCHATGKVRGVLCSSCNTGIGLLKEDPKLFDAAKAYIKNPPGI